jgi:hypothetical protein
LHDLLESLELRIGLVRPDSVGTLARMRDRRHFSRNFLDGLLDDTQSLIGRESTDLLENLVGGQGHWVRGV